MKNTMNGIWLENRRFSFRDDLPVPAPGEGEALVRVKLAGICSTDLELEKGYYPYAGIPGHEFVGEVASAPGDAGWTGQRVVGEINVACLECEACRAGRTHHCENRTVLGIKDHDGAFAEYLVLPVRNLHRVPAGVPDEEAVFTEPLAAALEIQEQVHIHPEDRVLLIGAGRLGQLIAQTLALTGCSLRVLARHPRQQDLLLSRQIQVVQAGEIEAGRSDVVVEATGSTDGFRLARQAVRPGGTIVLKSTYKGQLEVDFSSVVVDEVRLVGSRCGPFPPALSLLESGRVDPLPLIDARFPLADAPQGLKAAAGRGVLKVVLDAG